MEMTHLGSGICTTIYSLHTAKQFDTCAVQTYSNRKSASCNIRKLKATHTRSAAWQPQMHKYTHLVIHFAKSRGHLVGQRSSNDHDIRLPGAGSENNPEPVQIVPCCSSVHHFHGTAGKTKGHGPHRALASPVDKLVEFGYNVLCTVTRTRSSGRLTNRLAQS